MAIDPKHLPWNRLGMAESDWRSLAAAFYALAHSDLKKFEALPDSLKNHPIGKLCSGYIESRDHAYIEQAGKELTGTKEWYVYLGR